MATREQLEEGIRRANAAGDADSVRRLGAAYRAMSQAPQKPRDTRTGIGWLDRAVTAADNAMGGIPGKVISSANEALIGIPQGVENVGSFFTDPIVRAVAGKEVLNDERARRAGRWDAASRAIVSRPDATARTVGQIGGAMLVPAPKLPGAMAPGLLGKVARGGNRAIAGAMGGAAVRDSDQNAALPATIGAAANVVLPPALSAIANSKIGQKIAGAAGRIAQPILNSSDDTAEAILSRVKPALGLEYAPRLPTPPIEVPLPSLSGLGRKAEARAARFKALGIDDPTTGMVTRDPRAWTFEQEAAKAQGSGDDLARQMQGVQQKLADKARGLLNKVGGPKSAEEAGLSVQDALRPQLSNLESQVQSFDDSLAARAREMVQSAGGARGAEGTGLAAQSVLDAKNKEMRAVTGRLYESVRDTRGDVPVGRLGSFRESLGNADLVDDPSFDTIRTGITRRLERIGLLGPGGQFKEGAPATVNQVEGLRKFIGQMGDSRDPNIRRIRGVLIDSLDDDVVSAIGDDAFKAARESAKAGFAEFKKTFAGKIADEAIPPEALTRRILGDSTRLSDLRAMRQSLLSGTPEQIARGQEAWSAIKAQAMDDLFSGATGVDGRLNSATLIRNYNKSAAKFNEILSPDEISSLSRLVEDSADTSARSQLNAFRGTATGKLTSLPAPEDITKQILGPRTSLADIRAIRLSLSGTPEAWKAIQARSLEDLFYGADEAVSQDGAVKGGLLYRKFSKAAPKLREILGPEDFKTLNRFVQASRDVTVAPPMSSVNYSNTASTIGNMLTNQPEPVKKSILKLLAKNGLEHIAAYGVGGPPGNVALMAGKQVASAVGASRAEQAAAQAMVEKISLARNPEQMAAAVRAIQKAGESNPAVAEALKRWQFNVQGGTVGGSNAALAGQ